MDRSTTLPEIVKGASAEITSSPSSGAVQRMMSALQDPSKLFTSDQVAFMMATAARWAREAVEDEPSPLTYAAGYQAGYRARVNEENDKYRNQALYFDAGETITAYQRRQLRSRLDAEATVPHVTDHPGGPVDWDTGLPTTPSTRVRPTPAPLPADARTTATTPRNLTGSAA